MSKDIKQQNQRAFVKGTWSDGGENKEERTKDQTCLVVQTSNEVRSETNSYSDDASSIDELDLDSAYHMLCKVGLKVLFKNRTLKSIEIRLEDELLELKEKVSKLEKGKETSVGCKTCQDIKNENKKLKEEIA
ncbi:hypothetical protein Tco_1025890 [Tanacetum coccineum]